MCTVMGSDSVVALGDRDHVFHFTLYSLLLYNIVPVVEAVKMEEMMKIPAMEACTLLNKQASLQGVFYLLPCKRRDKGMAISKIEVGCLQQEQRLPR